jgi:hypothetical protein
MTTQIQRRRGTTAQHSTFTGAVGEVTVDTDKEVLVVHDGAQVGGYPQMRENGSNSALALGSAGTPSLKFSGDPNTGIYSPGADQVAISTNGTGRLLIDANGSLTATSANALVANFTGPANAYAQVTDGTGIFRAQLISNLPHIGAASNHSLVFTTNNTERMRLDTSGRLGLGTSSPGHLFDCTQTARVGASGGNWDLIVGNRSANWSTGVSFQGSSTNTNWEIGQNRLASNALTFAPSTAGGGNTFSTPLVTFTTTAVGIGTQTPASPLSVYGNTVDVVSAYIENNNAAGSGASNRRLYLGQGGTTAFSNTIWQNAGIVESTGSGGGLAIGAYSDSSTDPIKFYTGSTRAERARIDSSGRLLVGTSSTSVAGVRLLLQANAGDSTAAANIHLARGQATPADGVPLGNLVFTDSNHSNAAVISANRDGGTWTSGSSQPTRLVFSTTADGASSPTERMRIGANGYIKASNSGLYAVTNIAGGTEAYHQIISNAANLNLLTSATNSGGTAHASSVTSTAASGDLYRGYVESSGAIVYRVLSNGNVQNTNNSYGALSDIKLKENIVDANSQWNDLKSLQVRNYNFKEGQTHTQIGLIAQEVELVSPGLVSESPDRDAEGNDLGTVTKSVNYSVLYMKAVKALQEAMERIETLEAKVAALEAS